METLSFGLYLQVGNAKRIHEEKGKMFRYIKNMKKKVRSHSSGNLPFSEWGNNLHGLLDSHPFIYCQIPFV